MKKLAVPVYILMILMSATVPKALAGTELPDLIPVVINANRGTFEVRNVGEVASKPSQVFVNCSIRLDCKSAPCAVGLQLPGFIEKWNVLPFDVPALQPGGQSLFHVFGSGYFPHRVGVYGMAITVDPLKKIAESSESNNLAHLDTVVKMGSSSSAPVPVNLGRHVSTTSEGKGLLHLRILMNGNPIPFELGWTSPARGFLSEEYLFDSKTGKAVAPLTSAHVQPMKLRAGVYDLKVHERAVGGKDIVIKGIAIGKSETVEQIVDIHQPGVLNIMARWTHQPLNIVACAQYHNPVNIGRLGALMGGGSGAGGRSRGDCLDPNVYLAVLVSSLGRSDGNIARLDGLISQTNKTADGTIAVGENIQVINMEAGNYNISLWPVGHRELERILKGIKITSGGITERKLAFHWPGEKK